MTGRRFLKDSLWVTGSQYVARAVLLARGLVAAAVLGPAGFGAWNALNLILDYGAYASIGSLYGLDIRLPGLFSRGDQAEARRAMQGAWGLTLAGAAVFAVAVIAYLGAGLWMTLTGWGWGAPALMLAAVLVQLAMHYHAASFRAAGDFSTVSLGVTIQALVGGGIGFATVWTAGVWGLLWGWLAGGLVALWWMRRSPRRPPWEPADPRAGVALVRIGFPLFGLFALSLVLRSVDRIALVRFGGNEALGHYSIALIAAGLVLYPPEAVASVLFPRVAAAASGAGDAERARSECERAQRALCAILPLFVGTAALWAGPLLGLVLPAYGAAGPSLRALAVGSLLLSTATLPTYYMLGAGRGLRLLGVATVGTGLVATAVFLVAGAAPRPFPVALAAAIGQGAFAALVLWNAAAHMAADPRQRRALVVASLFPVLWAGLLLLTLSIPGPESIAGAAVRSVAFVIAYVPVLIRSTRALGLRSLLHIPPR